MPKNIFKYVSNVTVHPGCYGNVIESEKKRTGWIMMFNSLIEDFMYLLNLQTREDFLFKTEKMRPGNLFVPQVQ